jgi:hypothetical protein
LGPHHAIAKKQGWTQKEAEEYIVEEGFKVFFTSFYSCNEEYDDEGNQTNVDGEE